MTWTTEPRSFATWSTEVLGATPRITEDGGHVRITETGAVVSAGGNIRIIEFKQITWTNETPSFNPWTQEE